MCGAKFSLALQQGLCGRLKVYPKSTFYPVAWDNSGILYDETKQAEVDKTSKKSFALNLWNSSPSFKEIKKNLRVPILNIARKYCPTLMKHLQSDF